jgi:HEAT repeat protein
VQTKKASIHGIPNPYNKLLDNLSNQFRKGGMDTWIAAVALGFNPSDEALNILLQGMKSESADLRRAAAEAVKHHPRGKQASHDLVKLLDDESEIVVRVACESLTALQCVEAHDNILRTLNASNPMTRETGIRAIAQLWKASDFEVLLALHDNDRSLTVRKAAAWALREHANASTWKQLFDRWKAQPIRRHRTWACELTGEYGDESCTPAIKQLSLDEDGHVRKAASRAAEKIRIRID